MQSQQVEPTQPTQYAMAQESSARQGNGAPGSAPLAPRRRKHLIRWLIAAAVLTSSVLAWLLSLTSPLKLLELKTYDLRFVLNGKQPPPAGIVLAQLDANTEAAFPEPHIFWQPHFA